MDAMANDVYYQPDLAWVHHCGYSHHVENTRAGIAQLLRNHGLRAGHRVLDVGCGSGLLARALLAEGYRVHGIDASPGMIALAREHANGAEFDVVRLPTGLPPGEGGAVPMADAIVSTGHVLNYLDTREAIAAALREIAGALRPGGVLAIDLMTEEFCSARDISQVHAQVHDDWAIFTRFTRPEAHRFDRAITVFRRAAVNWRRSDEYHRNVTFDADAALQILRAGGVAARQQPSFGSEELPQGLVVLAGARR